MSQFEVEADDHISDYENDIMQEEDEEANIVGSSVSIDGEIPKIGMTFDTMQKARNYYNDYARRVGFSVRIKRRNKHPFDPTVYVNLILCCSCEGKYNKVVTPTKQRDTRRFDCKAEFYTKLINGKYELTRFIAEHTHKLVPPDQHYLLRSQRKLQPAQIRIIDKMHSSGIRGSRIHGYLRAEAGGAENLNYRDYDLFNHVQKKRNEFLRKGDVNCLQEWFKQKKKENKHFFSSFWTGEENEVRGVFFCDAKSRRDYGLFGDVMCFDTTFKTNNYNMVCAPFVGVNHHWQTTIFGCGLIEGETTDAVSWVLSTFLEAMGGSAPKVIFTDQSMAIANAISLIFPETHHRLCLWHIFQNATKHLSSQFSHFESFAQRFRYCIYEPETIYEFEECWDRFLEDYNLRGNEWLQGLFELRSKWALVYGHHHFCASVTTTQRSESINNFLKKYFAQNLLLRQFVDKYMMAMTDRREKEKNAEHQTWHTQRILWSSWKVEHEASKIYTRTLFEEFQKEYKQTLDLELLPQQNDEENSIRTYIVREMGPNKRNRTLTYNQLEHQVFCSCKKFEFEGILCCHALKLFRSLQFTTLPSKYYLKRWTRTIKDKVVLDPLGEAIPSDIDPLATTRYSELSNLSQNVVVKGAMSASSCALAKEILIELNEKLDAISLLDENQLRSTTSRTSKTVVVDKSSDDKHLRDPKTKKPKGQTSARMKHALENKRSNRKAQPKKSGNKVRDLSTTHPTGSTCATEGITNVSQPIINEPMNNIFMPSMLCSPWTTVCRPSNLVVQSELSHPMRYENSWTTRTNQSPMIETCQSQEVPQPNSYPTMWMTNDQALSSMPYRPEQVSRRLLFTTPSISNFTNGSSSSTSSSFINGSTSRLN